MFVRFVLSVWLVLREGPPRRWAHDRPDRSPAAMGRRARSRGQATAEYALVLLGAAAVALMLTAWAAKSGKISALFDAVVGQLIDKAG